jgi:hypothetical protein
VAKGRLFAMIGNARAWNAASARASDSRIRGADIRSPQTQQMAFCAMLSAHDSDAGYVRLWWQASCDRWHKAPVNNPGCAS